MPCRAGPMCPALHYPPRPLQKTCHCEPVTDVTGVAIRTPLRRAALAGRGRTSASTAFGASGRRPLRRAIGKRRVGVGLPDDPNRACANFPINRRAGCPQPAAWPCAVLPAGHTGPALQNYCVLPRADRVVCPYEVMPCRAGPMCPAAHRTPCKKPVIASQ